MESRNLLIVLFLGFIFVASGVLCAQRVIDLDKVWGDMRVLGAAAYSGRAIACGDINGDSFMDIIIGVAYADPGGRGGAGETYVIFGSSSPPSTLDLSTQSADITVCGAYAGDNSGWAVASGDVNNDGYDDVIIGAPFANPGDPPRSYAGKTYVIFGSSNPLSTIDLSTQSADITVYGEEAEDNFGYAVARGDINGDGYNDVIIAAPFADRSEPARYDAGETYVIFGESFPSPPYTIDLDTQSADINVYGDYFNDCSGRAVSSGDINGDGYDDLIIGSRYADPGGRTDAGKVYVIFGSSSPSSAVDLSIDSADIIVCGEDDGDRLGHAVASGDVNNDGYDDIIIGAYKADPLGGTDAGETYVVFGSSFASPPYTIDLHSQSADISVYGENANDWFGYALARGDVNGDRYDDIIIGARLADTSERTDAGQTYVIFGSSSPPATVNLSTQSADITVFGDDADDESGWGDASGDVNGDGYDDLIIGAYKADPGGRTDAGETYVIFGGGPLIASHGLGGKSWIKEFDIYGNSVRSFKAFGAVNSQGEVHLAVGEIDADGHDEIAAGQGEGGKSWVKFFEVDGSPISAFKAFGASNTNGELHLAMGNFDADPSDNEIAVAQGEGGQSWVKVFETDGTFITSIKAFGAANAKGEVHLATGDLNKDGFDEIITGTGENSISMVKIFHYWGGLIRNFKAFDSIDNPGGEVRLAVGNFNADPAVEIAAATGYNGGNKVRLFDKGGTLIGEFTAFGFGGNPNGDVQITATDIDNDGVDEIICAHGEGGGSWVKVFKPDGTVIRSFKAFGAVNAQGEVHLGKSNY